MIGTLLFLVALFLGVALYRWAKRNDDFFAKRNIKYLRPTFLLGSTGKFYMKQYRSNEFLQRIYNSFPDSKMIGLFDLCNPMYMIRDPEAIKRLTVKDFEHFENHQVFGGNSEDTSGNIFSRTLVMLRGEKWKHMRSTLSPAFTGSKMRQMFELVRECAADMSTTLRKRVDSSGEQIHTEVKDLLSKYSMDVIATTAFGIKVNSFEDDQNEFLVNGKKLLAMDNWTTLIKFVLAAMFPRVFKWLGINLLGTDVNTFFKSMVLGTMDVRIRENIFRPDMIQLLMPMRKGNKVTESDTTITSQDDDGFAIVEEINVADSSTVKPEWTDDDLVAQCFLFFAAGFDTVSSALTFLAHELAVNPDVQDKLFIECTETANALEGKPLPYDVLQKMKYMDQVVSEGLRMWPPAMFTDRVCNKNYEYDDGQSKVLIEKDTSIWIPIYSLHHDEKYFAEPEKFLPERFSDENKSNIVPGSYVPFGIGPRACIASRFALMEVKSLIYHLLLNFQLEPNEKTQIPLKLAYNVNLYTERGVHLHLKVRQ